jgi:predicted amidohydrolase YtcJ
MSQTNPDRRPNGRSFFKKFSRLIPFLFLALLVLSCAKNQQTSPGVELILEEGAVYTVAGSQPWAEAVAIAGGKIVYVGDNLGAAKLRAPNTKVVDLAGKMVLPGFHDSHIHLVSGGIELGQCNLNGLTTKEEIFAAIQKYASEHPEKKWIEGGGWDLPIFPEANPSKEELDKLVPERPAFLSAADGHSAWVNSRALEMAGVTAKTPDPKDGRIERLAKSGEPSGALRESAQGLVSRLIPETTAEEYSNGLRAGLDLANRFGITSILEADADEKILETYGEFVRRGSLTVRVLASIHVDPDKGVGQIPELIKKREKYRGRLLRAEDAKIFMDGVLESHTAALLEPYLDRRGDRGTPILEADALNRLATALDKAGFQIHIHAIGDRAIRLSLDTFEAAQKANGRRDARHHIAHLELIDPSDIPRFKELGVVANFQPLWAYADLYITKLTEPILGPERSRRLYPMGSVVRSGAVIAAGSDWSVSSMNPFEAIQVGVTRRALEDTAAAAWLPDELVDLPTLIAAYTINGAYLSHQEKITGSLEVGKAADLIVLDRNLFEIPASDIHKVKVLLTLLEGKEVWGTLPTGTPRT